MEVRPRGLLSNLLHSWGSAGVGSGASCDHMLSIGSPHTHVNLLIGVDKLKIDTDLIRGVHPNYKRKIHGNNIFFFTADILTVNAQVLLITAAPSLCHGSMVHVHSITSIRSTSREAPTMKCVAPVHSSTQYSVFKHNTEGKTVNAAKQIRYIIIIFVIITSQIYGHTLTVWVTYHRKNYNK